MPAARARAHRLSEAAFALPWCDFALQERADSSAAKES